MSSPLPSAPAVPDYAAAAPAQGLGLHRMPLVWVAVGVPAAFVVLLTFLTPSL